MSDLAIDATANMVAGLVVSLMLFPAESFKKVMQSKQHLRSWHPYRGFPVFALNVVPTTTVQLCVYTLLARAFPDDKSTQSKFAKCVAAGMMGATFATVVENTVTLQTVHKCSLRTAFTDMQRQHFLRPWKSASLIATRDVIFFSFMMVFEPLVRQYMHATTVAGELLAALPLAVLGAGLSHPFDTMATQMQKHHTPMTFRGALHEAMTLHGKGWRSLYAGYAARCVLFYGFMVIIPRARDSVTQVLTARASKRPQHSDDMRASSTNVLR